MATVGNIKTEDASARLHLSLVNLPRNYANANPGKYTYDERALGKGTWIVTINTGYNWERFPEVSSSVKRLEAFELTSLVLLPGIRPPGRPKTFTSLAGSLPYPKPRAGRARSRGWLLDAG